MDLASVKLNYHQTWKILGHPFCCGDRKISDYPAKPMDQAHLHLPGACVINRKH